MKKNVRERLRFFPVRSPEDFKWKSPQDKWCILVQSVISERGLILWEKKKDLSVIWILNAQSTCKFLTILAIDMPYYRRIFFRLKDRWPTDLTISLYGHSEGYKSFIERKYQYNPPPPPKKRGGDKKKVKEWSPLRCMLFTSVHIIRENDNPEPTPLAESTPLLIQIKAPEVLSNHFPFQAWLDPVCSRILSPEESRFPQ